jgi:molybdenum cofactor biosynthesis enzyme MoaA
MSKPSRGAKNFCALPFDHVTIRTNGAFDICCTHKTPPDALININSADHHRWIESEYVTEVRRSFESDQRHPGCRDCWEREDAGFDSLRVRTQREYAIYPRKATRPIKNIELQLGNLCNLQCLMCNEHDSSAILAENIRLGINQIQQSDMTWNDVAYENLERLMLEKPYVLNIRGGEPLYNKKLLKLVTEIPDSHARDMVLQIVTNATNWDERWRQALARFALIRFVFSLDATDKLFEYIRYPASWTQVTKNIESIMTLANVKCMVNCVGQNLNISDLEPLIDWCESRSLYLQIHIIDKPDHLQIQNLPAAQKSLAISNLQKLAQRQLPPHLEKFITSATDKLATTDHDPLAWSAFVKKISMRDDIRGNSFRNFIKEEPC